MSEMKIFVVEEEDKGTRLDQYLVKQLDLTRTRVQNLIKENKRVSATLSKVGSCYKLGTL